MSVVKEEMKIFNTYTNIEEFIKENYAPVEDKPGYVWFSKRNFQIIKIETLTELLKAYFIESEDKEC